MARRKQIGNLLLERGVITENQLIEALEEQKKTGELLGRIFIRKGLISKADLLSVLASQSGMETIDLEKTPIKENAILAVSPSVAQMYKVIPIRFEDNTLTIAISDPSNIRIVDDLRLLLGYEIKAMVADEDDINKMLDKYYRGVEESVEKVLSEMKLESVVRDIPPIEEKAGPKDIAQLQEMAKALPVVRLLNLILIQAINNRASDIHFEPFENQFKIRYRVDGILYDMPSPPKHLSVALTSRIKVMADMDIAERRLPQDGSLSFFMRGKEIDVRISTLPTIFGESVVMRILDKSTVMLSMSEVGLTEKELKTIRQLIKKPNGIILTTGPTGCGKTTTLYAGLKEVNSPEVKIITTEEPVEYRIAGIIQVPIRAPIGLTFAHCLRSILRQDPDVILVGEIRDKETAEIAIQASLTGHLVLSTLHTNDAAGAITRLIDMDIEPFLITSTLEAIIAQRLIRVICSKCRESYKPEDAELTKIGLSRDELKGKTFYRGRGCEECGHIGFRGRTGIFEILVMNDRLREITAKKGATKDIREEAKKSGMNLLRQAGMEKVFQGITTIGEVVRETLF
jgi:type IV pilus assembly protein PilB